MWPKMKIQIVQEFYYKRYDTIKVAFIPLYDDLKKSISWRLVKEITDSEFQPWQDDGYVKIDDTEYYYHKSIWDFDNEKCILKMYKEHIEDHDKNERLKEIREHIEKLTLNGWKLTDQSVDVNE